MLKAFDLFSGAGGLTEGLRRARFDVVGAIEIDPVAVESYRANHPRTHVWDTDVRSVCPERVMKSLGLSAGELDLLAGCPPCQGFSTLSTRKKALAGTDDRNDLVFEFTRFVRAMLPRAIMMENVPGLEKDRRFVKLTEDLNSMAYALSWKVVDASNYGVPQRRNRLILLGVRGSAQLPGVPEGSRGRRTVRQAIGHLAEPGETGDELHDLPENRSARVQELITRIPPDGGSRSDSRIKQLPCHERCDGFSDVYGRMAWDDVAPTITTGCHNPSKGRFIHPTQHRAISLREAALLQSFPPSYRFSLKRGKEHAALMIGNALPPRLIARVGEHISKQLRGTPS